MRLVLDSTVVLPFVAQTAGQGEALRAWLQEHLDGSPAHVVHTLTQIEILAALQDLEGASEIDEEWATHVQRRIPSWPFKQELLNAQRRERTWELRTRFSISGAAYIATTESLQAEHREDVALCTADIGLQGANLPCTVLFVPRFM